MPLHLGRGRRDRRLHDATAGRGRGECDARGCVCGGVQRCDGERECGDDAAHVLHDQARPLRVPLQHGARRGVDRGRVTSPERHSAHYTGVCGLGNDSLGVEAHDLEPPADAAQRQRRRSEHQPQRVLRRYHRHVLKTV